MNYLKQKNIKLGIIIFILVSTISYAITRYVYTGYFLYADLQFIAGSVLGVLYSLRNRKEKPSILTCGAIVGITGGLFSSLFIAFYEWLIASFMFGIDIITLIFFIGFTCLSGIPCGLIIGALMGALYMYKEVKGEKEEEYIDDDFFEDLIEK
ncbi:MAG: hypothetical protein JSV62_04845 [Promethearchaeota archaeon]|nr:MAG: hypothetical protein JSV62_04845 [Candidatus Lokiarchaeota archaeon]